MQWPDSVVIRELHGRCVAVDDTSELPNLCFLSSQPTFGKALEPHHLLAEPSVAGNVRTSEEPATSPGGGLTQKWDQSPLSSR